MFKLWTLAAFCVLIVSSAFATPTAAELAAFLNRTDRIRVAVTTSPGSGHQSAAAQAITELRRIGYTGWFEVVYDGIPSHDVGEKLSQVLPPFDFVKGGTQEYPELKLKFIPLAMNVLDGSLHAGVMSRHLPLGIAGGDDAAMGPLGLNVDTVLRFSPPYWEESRIIHGGFFVDLVNSDQLPFEYLIPEVSNIREFIVKSMGHTGVYRDKIDSLDFILNQQDTELTTIYGHHVRGQHQVQTYLASLFQAREGVESQFKGKTVVFLLNQHKPSHRYSLLRSIGLSPALNGRVQFTDATNPQHVRSQYQSMKEGDVLLVHVGAVSKPMFEYLYSRSTLPPVVEGVNSVDLLKSLGIPFLPSGASSGTPFDSIFSSLTIRGGRIPFERVVGDSAYQHLVNSTSQWNWARAAQIIFSQPTFQNSQLSVVARFIRASRVGSEVREAFARNRNRLTNFSQGRVGNAVTHLHKLYTGRLLSIRRSTDLVRTKFTSVELDYTGSLPRNAEELRIERPFGTTANSCDGQFKIAN